MMPSRIATVARDLNRAFCASLASLGALVTNLNRAARQRHWHRESRCQSVIGCAAANGTSTNGVRLTQLHPQLVRPRAISEALVDGFTLLEIILSLAILAGALAALGEVMRLGDQNAALARDESQAQILATSVMDEILAGVRPLTTVSAATFDLATDPPWAYSIEIAPAPDHSELLVIHVRVEQQLDPTKQPARFDLVRWVLNPDAISTSSTTTSSTSSSSTSSTGSGSSSSGQTTSGGTR